jgi:hypothetical protein
VGGGVCSGIEPGSSVSEPVDDCGLEIRTMLGAMQFIAARAERQSLRDFELRCRVFTPSGPTRQAASVARLAVCQAHSGCYSTTVGCAPPATERANCAEAHG